MVFEMVLCILNIYNNKVFSCGIVYNFKYTKRFEGLFNFKRILFQDALISI